MRLGKWTFATTMIFLVAWAVLPLLFGESLQPYPGPPPTTGYIVLGGTNPALLELLRFVTAMIVTFAVLSTGLYVILSRPYGDGDQKWAYGAVGAIIGFWLR